MSDVIAAWWNAFEAQVPRLVAHFKQRERWDLPGWMNENLGAIHPELMWEFGPAVRGPGHRLVITPENRRELRPLVRQILRSAPELPGWEFYEYRLPESFAAAVSTVESRTGGDLRGVQVQVRAGDFNRVDLLFVSPRFDSDDVLNVAFVAAETLLGEETLDRWVGMLDVSRDPDPAGPPPVDASDLSAIVRQAVEQIEDQLPAQPWCVGDTEGAEWTCFEIKPAEADDYTDQSDLLIGITMLPEMWQNALVGVPFDSARYSRYGERFCYLKIDGSGGLGESAFDDRAGIEEALNERLRPAALGSVVGGGTGLRYSYIELALTDVDAAWELIRCVLREGRLPQRTWLLFHDDELGGAWRGLYEETPSPPGPESQCPGRFRRPKVVFGGR